MDAPGKGMLKVVSILFIIFGAIGTIVTLIGLFGALALSSMAAQLDSEILEGAMAAVGGLLIVALIIGIIACVLELVIGIIGVGKAGDASKAGFFITTGIILCAIQLISIILTMLTPNATFPFMNLIGFVLPILFIVGGMQNKNAAAAPAA